MKLNCLYDFIGVRYHGAPVPDSGLYINSLPGINLKSMDSIADADQRNYFGVWADVQTNTLAKFAVDIIEKFRLRYKLKQINRSVDLGRKYDTSVTVDSKAEYRGIAIETVFKNNFNLGYSNFQSIALAKIALYLKDAPTGPVTLKVADMDTGEILDTFTIDSPVQRWNEVKVGHLYNNRRIFIGYDATGIDSYKSYINPNADTAFVGFYSNLYGSVFSQGYIRGAETVDNDFTKDPVYGLNSYGLTAAFQLVCSYDYFICNNRDSFAMPLQYLLAAELMIELMASDRLNRYTTLDIEKAQSMLEYYQNQYDRALTQVITSTDLDTSDVCLECNATIQYVNTMP